MVLELIAFLVIYKVTKFIRWREIKISIVVVIVINLVLILVAVLIPIIVILPLRY